MSSSSNFKTPLPMGEGLGVRLLKQYWGYDTFRGIQEDIINSITEGRDTLGLMPTGGGKSITFQVPALAKEGLCLVITPLIALMKDQVQNLKKRGIKALAIYSGMSRQEIIVTLENCIFGNFKFLYISLPRLGVQCFKKCGSYFNHRTRQLFRKTLYKSLRQQPDITCTFAQWRQMYLKYA